MSKDKKEKICLDVLKETKLQTFQDHLHHSQQCHILDENLRDDHITDVSTQKFQLLVGVMVSLMEEMPYLKTREQCNSKMIT